MSDFSEAFVEAFDHAMLYEVGRHWDATDNDVIEGAIETKTQRRKVGYVNIPQDRGGETKYGIAQKANPDINVRDLDLHTTMDVYYDRYWMAGRCDKLSPALSIMHFDGCVNHGVGRATKFLQQAAGVTADGKIGPGTLNAIGQMDEREIVQALSEIRSNFYNAIVARDPSQKMFLKGWMTRINEITDFTMARI